MLLETIAVATPEDDMIFNLHLSLLKTGLAIMTNVGYNQLARRDLFKRNIFEFCENVLQNLPLFSRDLKHFDEELMDYVSRFLSVITKNFDSSKIS